MTDNDVEKTLAEIIKITEEMEKKIKVILDAVGDQNEKDEDSV